MDKGLLKAYFGNNEVAVSGGFQHPTKGHEVEIAGENVPRRSVSIWELNYNSLESAHAVFKSCFNCSPEVARDKDRKKGVLITPVKISKTDHIKHKELSIA